MKKRLKKKKMGENWIKPTELWSLDLTIANFVLPRLIAFKKNNIGYPSEFKSKKEWDNVLDKMIAAFNLIINGDNILDRDEYQAIEKVVFDNKVKGMKFILNEEKRSARLDEIDRQNEIIQEGLRLFATYFRSLWY